MKQLVSEVGAHVTHRRRLNALGEESDSTRPKVVGDGSQIGDRTIQNVNLDDRRQLDQRTHPLVSDIVVESELVARTGHLATCGERFTIPFEALQQLDDDGVRVEQLPAPVEQLAARKVDESDAAARDVAHPNGKQRVCDDVGAHVGVVAIRVVDRNVAPIEKLVSIESSTHLEDRLASHVDRAHCAASSQ